VGAAKTKHAENRETRRRISLSGNYPKVLWAEMGKGSFAATTDDRDDAIEVRVGHGSARREAEASIEQILGHLSPYHSRNETFEFL